MFLFDSVISTVNLSIIPQSFPPNPLQCSGTMLWWESILFLYSGVRECEERIGTGKDIAANFAVKNRKFSERDYSLLTGTITPSGRRW